MTEEILERLALLTIVLIIGIACSKADAQVPQEDGTASAATSTTSAAERHTVTEQPDHLILAINDLQAGIERLEKLTGVRAVVGGRHPHLGTQNALIALGPHLYLEILAPHPEMELIDGMRWLHNVTDLEPMGWAVSTTDMERLIETLRSHGYGTTGGSPGSRARPDGATLNWITMGLTSPAIAAAPFFIEWSATTEHPAVTSPGGCKLDRLAVTVPDPDQLRRLLELLQIEVAVKRDAAAGPSMALSLDCPDGRVEFKGFTGRLPAVD